ncbi:high mobility group B protein 15-like isoform X2 [Magnolia sinica]|uniref:high mobility group B protein 15-like isoform X2 n=1 Tax=Magnolia sinica TaxID=86752 RepID=UPI00265A1067|nr:high mobility group B protein 15-like isoform X2 [Magnolia sinica]
MAECSSSCGGGVGGSKQNQQQVAVVSSSSVPIVLPISAGRDLPPNYCPYPPPLAKYEEVLSNGKLFMDTLEKLHATMGTKFMVPTIGGKELDLHRLFVEVTSRGGLEKVIRDRRWKEITAVFSFPSTATNASFILRKYYVSLIHNYEQIYFFGAQVPPPVPSPASIPVQGSVEPVPPSSEAQAASQKRRRSRAGECLPGASLPSPVGCPVFGVIDGKFEHGYLVTVMVGSEKLTGVLYHAPEYSAAQMAHYSSIANHGGNGNAATPGVRRRRRRKKSEMRKRDPSHPKPNRSGYNFFFAEQHARLKPLHPGKDREISKMIGELWNNISETDKAVYQEKGVKDKERYRSEMEEYKERLKTGPIIRNAVPIQQRPAVPEAVDVELKIEMEEEGFPETPGNDSSSEESDSEEGKLADKDSEVGASPEAGTAEGDGFELQRRNHDG